MCVCERRARANRVRASRARVVCASRLRESRLCERRVRERLVRAAVRIFMGCVSVGPMCMRVVYVSVGDGCMRVGCVRCVCVVKRVCERWVQESSLTETRLCASQRRVHESRGA